MILDPNVLKPGDEITAKMIVTRNDGYVGAELPGGHKLTFTKAAVTQMTLTKLAPVAPLRVGDTVRIAPTGAGVYYIRAIAEGKAWLVSIRQPRSEGYILPLSRLERV